jgi:hypothetical protein
LSPSTVVHVAGGLATRGEVRLAAHGGKVLVVAGGLTAHGDLAAPSGNNCLVRFSLLASPFLSSLLLLLLLLLLSLVPLFLFVLLCFGSGC